MNPNFGQAWIGFAHTFAAEGEHEQAIAAYSTAARLFPGTHLPALFLGMQHTYLHNLNLAEEYLMSSFSICKTDPLLLNELGVVFYHKQEYHRSLQYFRDAMEAVAELDSDPVAWLSVQTNLGHVHRHLGKFDEALGYFEQVLRINPRDSNVHSAMGMVNLEAGRIMTAIENFHDALSITRNEPVATELLQRALEQNGNDFHQELDRDLLAELPELEDFVGVHQGHQYESAESRSKISMKSMARSRIADRRGRQRTGDTAKLANGAIGVSACYY